MEGQCIYRLVGARIGRGRLARGLTREELAAAIGATADDVRAWEKGRQLEPETLIAIVEALAVPLSYLFDDRDD
jgi:transcriptional regulator with XRE-family HTH domain